MAYRLLVLALLAAALAYLMLARQIPLDPWSAQELVNSRTLPTLYGALLAGTLGILLFRRAPRASRPRHGYRAIALIGVLIAFVWLVPRIGIWLALGFMLLTSLIVMGERRPALVMSIAAGVPGVGWLLVETLLGIHVPGFAG